MKTFNALLCALALTALAGTATAQQQERNDAGGSLQGNGFTVHEGCTIPYGPNDTVELLVSGAPTVPLILLLGELAPTSIPTDVTMEEYFDLDLTSFIFVLVDGFGGSGAIPFFDDTNANGEAFYAFPLNPSITFDFAFQAVVFDPAAPFGLNFTAAAPYSPATPKPPFSTTGTSLQADDDIVTATLTSPICMYGTNYTQIVVSSNGFISFGNAETSNDLSESVSEFLAGNPGGSTNQSPLIAVGWEDLDFANRPSQGIAIEEVSAGVVQVRFVDADRFAEDTLGDFTATIDSSTGTTIITLDYTMTCGNFTGWTPLVGVSGGNNTLAAQNVDFATDGVVNPITSTGSPSSIYQYFSTPNTFDLNGTTLTFADAGGCTGDFIVF